LIAAGYREQEVLDMPLNKVELLVDVVSRTSANRRVEAVYDLTVAIGAAFSGKGLKEYAASLGVNDG